MSRRTGVAAAAVLAALAVGCAGPTPAATPWPVVVEEGFAGPSCSAAFAYSDATRWRWSDADERPSLELLGGSVYRPPFRSPTSVALLREFEFADFDLEIDVLQTGPEYGHRDLCLFFGWQSPARFHYVHLATTPDPHAHNVFAVANAPRVALLDVPRRGVAWGDTWHRVRLERRLAAGTLRVFLDGGDAPILEATGLPPDRGRVGFGSFDDSGRFANLRIRAPAAHPAPATQPFAR